MLTWTRIEPLWSGAPDAGGVPSPTPDADKAGTLYPPGQEPKPADPSVPDTPPAEKPPGEPEAEKSADEKVPDGDYQVRSLAKDQAVDKEALSVFQPAAKEIGLTQAQFDKLAPVYPKIVETIVQRQAAQNAEMIKGWETDAREDKEFGGRKFDENIGLCREVINTYGTPELRQILQDSGLGNHKEIMRLLYRFGTAHQKESDGSVRGSTQPRKSAAEILYGGTPAR